MVRKKQIHFLKMLGEAGKTKLVHGGNTRLGQRKIRRPLDTKKPLHLVMRASVAKGEYSLLNSKNKTLVEAITRKQAAKFGVRIANYANVGNHLHLLVRFSNRRGFQAFLKSSTAMIARAVTNAKKGNPFGKFWDRLAFSRIVTCARDLQMATKYIKANIVEARQGRTAREMYLDLRAPWEQRLYSG